MEYIEKIKSKLGLERVNVLFNYKISHLKC